MEEVLELLKGCGLTTPAQIRGVVLRNPRFLFHSAEIYLKPKLRFLGTLMKKEDIAKLLFKEANIFNSSDRKHKSAISVLQNLGIEGEALSELLARLPRLLTVSEEKVIESFKQAEDLGFKKGTNMFAFALRALLGLGEENLNRRRQFLISFGFSENQTSDLCRRRPSILRIREEKVKLNVDFVVNILGLPLADLVKYPALFEYSVETRMIPRYRVMEALKSMHVQVPKKKEASIFMLTEKRFLENYVYSNAESSSLLLDIYKETCGECISDKVIHETC
jgi:mTERF domain-containing protein